MPPPSLHHINPGLLEVYTGPMYGGKTDHLKDRIDPILHIHDKPYLWVEPSTNVRKLRVPKRIQRHFFPADHPEKIFEYLNDHPQTRIIAIDEGQFAAHSLVMVVEKLLARNQNVIVGGLDLDFRGETFGCMGDLMARAHYLERCYKGKCHYTGCENVSVRTQRLIDGKPAPYDSPIVIVEDKESKKRKIIYETRCHLHHFVPGKPGVRIIIP
ncbi:hypothetical protein J4464_05640 [Candidatus Woesearchaeota archaeon]|nr:hypothetical protein [Candidatus Woesearchaeota archaeon]